MTNQTITLESKKWILAQHPEVIREHIQYKVTGAKIAPWN
jgi:hypothetical protein